MAVKALQCLTEVSITGLLITLIGLLLQFSHLYATLFLNMAVPVTLAGNCAKEENERRKKNTSNSARAAEIALGSIFNVQKTNAVRYPFFK